MVSQEQLKHQRLMQLQLQDEIKELTHQRDCLKMEFQQMTEVKPFLARSYNKTAHPNLTQKIQHLENKNRHLNGMLKQQQAYSEQILHRELDILKWFRTIYDLNFVFLQESGNTSAVKSPK